MAKVSVVVVGGGVIGLTTAISLQRSQRYSVTVVARDVPAEGSSDKGGTIASSQWASPFAGANWRPYAEVWDTQQRAAEEETYFKLRDIEARSGSAGVKTVRMYDFGVSPGDFEPLFLGYATEVKRIERSKWPEHARFGYEYDSFAINVPVYLNWLAREFRQSGGVIRRAELTDIHEAVRFARWAPCAVVVNCAAMGSRVLRGVYDTSMYPTRGQTLLVRAPRVTCNYTAPCASSSKAAYVIPRGDGTVIIGGVFEHGNYSQEADAGTTTEILKNCLALCPQLLGNQPREDQFRAAVMPEDVERLRHNIVSVNVGFRPSRRDGPRLEAQRIGGLTVLHNYGHSSFGYQTSWGYASATLRMLDATLSQDCAAKL